VPSDRTTGEYTSIPSHVITQRGESRGPWPFARLVEALATGEVTRGDMVDYLGRGLAPIESIEELARFLPALTATTNQMASVGAPDFADDVSTAALITILLRVFETEATGVLFAEGPTESRRLLRADALLQNEGSRKELYFVGGRLHHVSSSNASELLGQFLIRRGNITRAELDFALALLPRHGGRMGDTLVSLGLISSLEVFRAIREQGAGRLVDLFQWPSGRLTFYVGHTAPHVEFPLDLELLPLVLTGLQSATQDEPTLEALRARAQSTLGPAPVPRPKLRDAAWPPMFRRLLDATAVPKPLAAVLARVAPDGDDREALRGLELLLAAKLIAWQ
jgi:serine/threonine-protein kinase